MKDQRLVRNIVGGIVLLLLLAVLFFTSGCSTSDIVTEDAPVAVPASEPVVADPAATMMGTEEVETPAPERMPAPPEPATATATITPTLTLVPEGTSAP